MNSKKNVYFFLSFFIFKNVLLCNLNDFIKKAVDINTVRAKSEKFKDKGDYDILLIKILDKKIYYDDKYIDEIDLYFKALNDEGAKKLSNFSYNFSPSSLKTLTLNRLEILRTDGKIQTLASEKKMELNNEEILKNSSASNIYVPEKSLNVNSKLDIGEILHIKVTFLYQPQNLEKKLESGYHFISSITESFPTLSKENLIIFIDMPLNIKNIKVLNNKGNSNHEILIFEKSKVVRVKSKNLLPIKQEKSSPSDLETKIQLLVTTEESWKKISSNEYSYIISNSNLDELVKKFTLNLIKNSMSQKEKFEKVLDYVSNNIRYLGIESTINQLDPLVGKASYVLEKGYGVCRDKVALLIAMLKAISIKAESVLVNTKAPVDKDVPLFNFDHMVCKVYLDDKEVFVDPTYCNGKLPEKLMGKHCLVCSERGDDLTTLPFYAHEISNLNTNIDIKYEDNLFKVEALVEYRGSFKNEIDHILKYVTKPQEKVFIENAVKNIYPLASIKEYSTHINKDNTLIRVIGHLKEEEFMTIAGNIKLIDFYSKLAQMPNVALNFHSIFDSKERVYPIVFFPFKYNVRVEIDFKNYYEDIKIYSLPSNFQVNKDSYSMKLLCDAKNKKITYIREEEYKKERFMPEEYKELYENIRKFDNSISSNLILN